MFTDYHYHHVKGAQLYNRNTGFPLLFAIMSRNRFKWILRHLCFDHALSTHDRKARQEHDRLAAIRELYIKALNKRFSMGMVLDVYLTIDEALYPTGNQVNSKGQS